MSEAQRTYRNIGLLGSGALVIVNIAWLYWLANKELPILGSKNILAHNPDHPIFYGIEILSILNIVSNIFVMLVLCGVIQLNPLFKSHKNNYPTPPNDNSSDSPHNQTQRNQPYLAIDLCNEYRVFIQLLKEDLRESISNHQPHHLKNPCLQKLHGKAEFLATVTELAHMCDRVDTIQMIPVELSLFAQELVNDSYMSNCNTMVSPDATMWLFDRKGVLLVLKLLLHSSSQNGPKRKDAQLSIFIENGWLIFHITNHYPCIWPSGRQDTDFPEHPGDMCLGWTLIQQICDAHKGRMKIKELTPKKVDAQFALPNRTQLNLQNRTIPTFSVETN